MKINSPTEPPVSMRLAHLTPEKRQLIERLLSAKKLAAPAFGPIRPRQPSGRVPLSYAQQGLWTLDQLTPASPFYNESFIKKINFPVNSNVLERTLNEIIRRHEALRTSFALEDGEPVQRIAPQLSIRLNEADFSRLPHAQREPAAIAQATEEALVPFELSKGPCIRAGLMKISQNEYWLLLVIHHIVLDGWSYSVLCQELASIYQAFAKGEPSPLPELPIQYADYAVWQRNSIRDNGLQKQLDYWRQNLAGIQPLDLPSDRPRPATPSFRGGTKYFDLDGPASSALKELGQRHNATTFMVTLAGLAVLLNRWSGQDDFVLGVPIANRSRPELEPLIGFFVNAIVIRIDCSGDPTFSELLQRCRTSVLGAFSNQEIPFEKLVEELQPQRDTSRNPIFQIVFQCNYGEEASSEPLSVGTDDVIKIGTSKFDLRIDLFDDRSKISGYIEYSSDLFNAQTADRMASHYLAILKEAAADADCKISHFDLLTKSERQKLLVDWNRTQTNSEKSIPAYRLFEQAAASHPNALAVAGRGQSLQFGEVNQQANRLAAYLRSQGVGVDDRVIVCTERAPHMLVSWLAVWKAGAAYVPLDVAHPVERLRQMTEDAVPRFIITDRACAPKIGLPGVPRICIDAEDEMLASFPTGNLEGGATSSNPAYVIYTSGSTGVPRGVVVEHRALSNMIAWHRRFYRLTSADKATQFASPAFDASVWEVWPYWCAGASIHIVPDDYLVDHKRLLDWIASEEISVCFLPTLVAEAVLDLDWPSSSKMRELQTAGDRLRRAPSRPLPFRFTNLYGPTENAVVATWAEVDSSESGVPPIGRPIDNVRAYVLDRSGQLVPIGVPGELCLAGDSLARGYLGCASLTDEKFFHGGPNLQERLYRTGDLVRYRSDGNLEFLGRLDGQVKLRGYRIEPGDIEAALLRVPGVKEAVVICREDQPGEKRLVAYVAAAESHSSEDNRAMQGAHVAEWQRLYEETYKQPANGSDPAFNITGWNSSYTGEPIPVEEMRQQVEETVARLRGFNAKRVLEIGCGTGLLLFRMAPHAEEYTGTDFSPAALGHVQAQLGGLSLPHVRLLEQTADCFDRLSRGGFDLIVLNSVVQYFPSAEYLVRVLTGALQLLAPGGRLFVGDVRSMPLNEAFHASVELHRADAESTVGELRDRLSRRIRQEPELVIAPELFTRFATQEQEAIKVSVLLKRGTHQNELTAYRYDAVLLRSPSSLPSMRHLQWPLAGGLKKVREMLRRPGKPLRVSGVPNARVASSVRLVELLGLPECPSTAAEISRAVAAPPAMDPHEFWSWEADLPWKAHISVCVENAALFDVTFVPADSQTLPAAAAPVPSRQAWREFTNSPLERSSSDRLELALRTRLREALPEYMVPAAFVVLPSLPRTPNGKLDRRGLPQPDRIRSGSDAGFVVPRTRLERRVAAIWREVLGTDAIGIHDNFFDLGGHSLLMIRLHARLREELAISHSVTDLFRYPTVSALAKWLDEDEVPPAIAPAAKRATKANRAMLRVRKATNHA